MTWKRLGESNTLVPRAFTEARQRRDGVEQVYKRPSLGFFCGTCDAVRGCVLLMATVAEGHMKMLKNKKTTTPATIRRESLWKAVSL